MNTCIFYFFFTGPLVQRKIKAEGTSEDHPNFCSKAESSSSRLEILQTYKAIFSCLTTLVVIFSLLCGGCFLSTVHPHKLREKKTLISSSMFYVTVPLRQPLDTKKTERANRD